MKKPLPRPPQAREERRPLPPSDSDRLVRGMVLESGESRPPPQPRLH